MTVVKPLEEVTAGNHPSSFNRFQCDEDMFLVIFSNTIIDRQVFERENNFCPTKVTINTDLLNNLMRVVI